MLREGLARILSRNVGSCPFTKKIGPVCGAVGNGKLMHLHGKS